MLDDSVRLQGRAREIIEDAESVLLLSIASVWEISVEIHAGRLALPLRTDADFHRELRLTSVQTVDIELPHAVAAAGLPCHHGDPFDRIIVAQARTLGIPLITADAKLAAYDVATIIS